MELIEKQVSSELKYKGVIVDVYLDRAELCDGKIARREVVKHPGGVTVLPVDSDGMCYMVRQYRYPAGKTLLETPAGKLEYGEEHLSCAVRELSEETGFSTDELIDLGCCYTSPGFSTEIIHVYLARGLSERRKVQLRHADADGRGRRNRGRKDRYRDPQGGKVPQVKPA